MDNNYFDRPIDDEPVFKREPAPPHGGCYGCVHDIGYEGSGFCAVHHPQSTVGGLNRPTCTFSGSLEGGEHGKPCEHYEAAVATPKKSV